MTAAEDQRGSLELLRRVPSFSTLSDADLERIATRLGERSVAAGEVVLEDGAAGDQSFLIAEGSASVLSGGVTIALVGAGEFIGELALLTDSPRCATVRADTPMRLLVLDKQVLSTLIDPITEALLGTLARRLRQADEDASAANDPARQWPIGSAVAVRSRYAGSWLEGFEVADLDLAGPTPRIQVRRQSDRVVLPVAFDTDDIRLV